MPTFNPLTALEQCAQCSHHHRAPQWHREQCEDDCSGAHYVPCVEYVSTPHYSGYCECERGYPIDLDTLRELEEASNALAVHAPGSIEDPLAYSRAIERAIARKGASDGADAFNNQYLWGGRVTRDADALATALGVLEGDWADDGAALPGELDLSGQWADGPTIGDVLDAVADVLEVDDAEPRGILAIDREPETIDWIVTAYQDAYNGAVRDDAERSALQYVRGAIEVELELARDDIGHYRDAARILEALIGAINA